VNDLASASVVVTSIKQGMGANSRNFTALLAAAYPALASLTAAGVTTAVVSSPSAPSPLVVSPSSPAQSKPVSGLAIGVGVGVGGGVLAIAAAWLLVSRRARSRSAKVVEEPGESEPWPMEYLTPPHASLSLQYISGTAAAPPDEEGSGRFGSGAGSTRAQLLFGQTARKKAREDASEGTPGAKEEVRDVPTPGATRAVQLLDDARREEETPER
jgi:hypothetical protein